jgi:hypothetical protein
MQMNGNSDSAPIQRVIKVQSDAERINGKSSAVQISAPLNALVPPGRGEALPA